MEQCSNENESLARYLGLKMHQHGGCQRRGGWSPAMRLWGWAPREMQDTGWKSIGMGMYDKGVSISAFKILW